MLIQLNPPIPLETPKGSALAHALIDYGPEHDLLWVTFVDHSGECWTWPNPKVRAPKNITMGRRAEGTRPDSVPAERAYMDDGAARPVNGAARANGTVL